LVLNYDIRTVPDELRPELQKFAQGYEGVDVTIGFFEFEPKTS
jgi:hypothetical protein